MAGMPARSMGRFLSAGIAMTACAASGVPSGTATGATPRFLAAATENWNCETEHVNWGVWPIEQKRWCCQHKGKACPPGVPQPYNCEEGETSSADWPRDQQTWCCKVRGVACSSEIYDCENGWDDFWAGEDVNKMLYCCKYSDYPCPSDKMTEAARRAETTMPEPTTTTESTTTAPTTTTPPTTTTATTTTATTTTVTSTTQTTVTTVTSTATTTTVTTTTVTTTTLDPDLVTMECSEEGYSYLPLDMMGHPLEKADGVAECQARCRVTEGCAHFSYYKHLGDCHLQDQTAVRAVGQGFISGPPECSEENMVELDAEYSQADGSSSSSATSWGSFLSPIPAACLLSAVAWGVFRHRRGTAALQAGRSMELLPSTEADAEQPALDRLLMPSPHSAEADLSLDSQM